MTRSLCSGRLQRHLTRASRVMPIVALTLLALHAKANAARQGSRQPGQPADFMVLRSPSSVNVGLSVRDESTDRRVAAGTVVVSTVTKGSSADIVGIKPGDIIEAVDDLDVDTGKQLFVLLGDTPPGKAARLRVRRGSMRFDVRVVPQDPRR